MAQRLARIMSKINRAAVAHKATVLARGLRLCLAILHLKANPSFVKVGANDGITADPCGDMLLKLKRFKGHLIEPVPYVFEKLSRFYGDTRRFKCHQLAISAKSGTSAIYHLSPRAKTDIPDLPRWWDQVASIDKGHLEKHFGSALSPYFSHHQVQTVPLGEFLKYNLVDKLDFLHIDTEGHDLVVLETMNFDIVKPSLVLIEIKHLSEEDRLRASNILADAGYGFLFPSCSDLLACDSQYMGRIAIAFAWIVVMLRFYIGRLLHQFRTLTIEKASRNPGSHKAWRP